MKNRVCIIGGTGFVGRAIARQAIDAGHQVVVTSRCPSRARDMLVKGIHVIKADITTGRGLDTAVQGSDCVINLVGLLFEAGKNTFDAAHVQGTKNIIQACKDAGVSQLLHMSALLSNEAIKNSKYGSTKHAAELEVQESGLAWSIFKPSIIFGAHDSFLMRFKSLSALGPVLPVIAGETKFQPVWVEDVARAFVLSIDNNKVASQVYTLAGPETYTFKTMLGMWMDALGRNRVLLSLPSFAASFIATVSKLLPVPLITTDQLLLLKYDNIAQGDSFPSIFGSTASFEAMLPALACGGQAKLLQNKLDQARTHYRKS